MSFATGFPPTLAARLEIVRDLAAAGFSAPPDPALEPELRAIWDRFEDSAAQYVAPTLTQLALPSQLEIGGSGDGGGRKSTRDRSTISQNLGLSRNWSGGVARPYGGRRFRRIGGVWRAPSVNAAAAEDIAAYHQPGFEGHGDDMVARCSIWVGLDGYFGWANSMPQLGSEHVVGAESRLWLQWWRPASRHFQVYLDDPSLIIEPGDEIGCYMEISDDGENALFRFLRISATGAAFVCSIAMEAETGHPALGSTAQAILERPSAAYIEAVSDGAGGFDAYARSAGIYPMPDFGAVEFSEIAASSRSASKTELEVSSDAMGLLSNFTTRHSPSRTAIVSRAEVPAHGTLRFEYTG